MGLFGNLKSDGLEEAQDRLGGFTPLETDVYTGPIKIAYAGKADSGAQNVTIIAEIGGREFRETIYITNKKGENFFLNKNDQTKKVPLPGFTTVDNICLIATGLPLCDQATEDKMVKVWDKDQKTEVPKSVPVLVDLLGKEVSFAILKQTVDITEKSGSDYVPTGKTRDENTIDAVFDPESGMTVSEAKNGVPEATFQKAWLEKNKGQTRDKTDKNGATQTGRPGRPAGGPPQAGNSGNGGGRPSLFGKKAA